MSKREDPDSEVYEALHRYEEAEGVWDQVRQDGLADIRFALNGEQWPIEIEEQRKREGRPCLTINRLPAMYRQVVNDARQNRPSIKVRPVDNKTDAATADIYAGIIRNIESTSDADVAYDTAVACAISSGWGFWTYDIDYADDSSFDFDIKFRRILNHMSVLFDPLTQAADSSDWRFAFITEDMARTEFEKKYPGAQAVSFEGQGPLSQGWFGENTVRLAEYFTRDPYIKTIWKMSDGQVFDEETLKKVAEPLAAVGITAEASRQTKGYKVNYRLMTGAEDLEKKTWPGSLIPVVPCYGEEVNIDGKRVFYSMIHHGKDAQRSFNFWRSAGAELIALAPRTPWVINENALPSDPAEVEKWGNSNSESHAYLLYRGGQAPERTQFAGVPAGVLQEANLAADDMREIIGVNNAAMGVPNPRQESGRALMQRRKEADTSTYHFTDNLARAVRCGGRILVDLIPHVYSAPQIMRVMGLDGKTQNVPVNQPIPTGKINQETGQEITRVYDLTVGKYDVVVEAGPSFTTRREETAEMMQTFLTAAPQAAPILGPVMMKMADVPDGEKYTAMLATMMPPAARAIFDGTPPPPPSPPPEVMVEQQKAQANIAINQQKAQTDAQLEQQKAENRNRIEMTQAQADIEVMRQKAAAEMQIERERAALQLQLKREEAALAAELKREQAQITGAIQVEKASQTPDGDQNDD